MLLAALAAVCLIIGLNTQPRLYPIDFGQYEKLMGEAGLQYEAGDSSVQQYLSAVSVFEYTHFSWARMFTPNAYGSTVLGVAAVRLLTEPFGLPFSADSLAAVWSVLLVLAVYSLTRSTYSLIDTLALVPGVVLCLIFTDTNFCAMLRGLYPQGAAAVFTLLFAAAALRAFTTAKGRGLGCLLPVCVSGVLFLKSFSAAVIFIPLVLAVFVFVLVREYKNMTRALFFAALCSALLALGCISSVRYCLDDNDYFSNAAVYHSVFDALLVRSDDPKADLEYFGLDESYLADVGMTYYDVHDAYAHDPRDEQEAQKLFAALTPAKVAGYYLTHPARLAAVLGGIPEKFNGYDSTRNVAFGQSTTQDFYTKRADGGIIGWLRLLLPGTYFAFAALCGCAAVLGVVFALRKKRKRLLLVTLLAISAMLYIPFCIVFCGYDGFAQLRLYQVLEQDLLLMALAAGAAYMARRWSAWLNIYSDTPHISRVRRNTLGGQNAAFARFRAAVTSAFYRVSSSRRGVLLCVGALAALMVLYTEFKVPHAVCVNNGDFGRLMGNIGINWSSGNYFDTVSQSNRLAIEDYAFLEPFDWQRLTFLKPTFSHYYFASIIRLFTEPFGLAISSWQIALLMSAIGAGCILLITRDLFDRLGRWTLVAGAGLCVVFCSETYLVWYNSMYGEACMLLGILMCVACAVHLSVISNTGKARIVWLGLLAVSLHILCCAKSQMLVALPFALALLCVMFWRHRPYRYDRLFVYGLCGLALCAMLTLSSIGVYTSERGDNGISQRCSMWHTFFYGIFMISDDPIADMEALGIDTAMAPDIGKPVMFDKTDEYVYAPLSEEAQTAFYDHVSIGKSLVWYLTHPTKLLYMLDYASDTAHTLYTDYRIYAGQDYNVPHDQVDGFGWWQYSRDIFAPTGFLGNVLIYGSLLVWVYKRLRKKSKADAGTRLLMCTVLFVVFVGVFQFPLTILGNGFADNQKQMFMFITVHDMVVLLCGVLVLRALWNSDIPRVLRAAADVADDAGRFARRTASTLKGKISGGSGKTRVKTARIRTNDEKHIE